MTSPAMPIPPALPAAATTAKVPDEVGSPVISPLVPLTDIPGGRLLAPKQVGLLLAVIEKVNAWPTWVMAVDELLITGMPGAGSTVMFNSVQPMPLPFVAEIVTG
jgi:hypothetical protein